MIKIYYNFKESESFLVSHETINSSRTPSTALNKILTIGETMKPLSSGKLRLSYMFLVETQNRLIVQVELYLFYVCFVMSWGTYYWSHGHLQINLPC